MVLTNLEGAFRISFVPYALYGLAYLVLMTDPLGDLQTSTPLAAMDASFDFWSRYALHTVVILVTLLWVAVSWHRYVLLNERARGWVPIWQGRAVWGYFVRTVLVGLAVTAVAIFIGYVSAILMLPFVFASSIVPPVLMIAAAFYTFYRICLMLPAAAIGKPMNVFDAVHATRDQFWTIAVLALIVVGLSILIEIPTTFSGDPTSWISRAYNLTRISQVTA